MPTRCPAPSVLGASSWRQALTDIGTSSLRMVPFVTLEGAGRHVTFIVGDLETQNNAVINGRENAALRKLAVENKASTSGAAVVVATGSGTFSIEDVAIRIVALTAVQAYGIFASGGELALTNVSIRVEAPSGQGTGIRGQQGVAIDMMNTWVDVQSDSIGDPSALVLLNSSAVGFGVLFSSNFFGLFGRGAAFFELYDGTVIGNRGVDGAFSGSFTCVAIADAAFTARNADCT